MVIKILDRLAIIKAKFNEKINREKLTTKAVNAFERALDKPLIVSDEIYKKKNILEVIFVVKAIGKDSKILFDINFLDQNDEEVNCEQLLSDIQKNKKYGCYYSTELSGEKKIKLFFNIPKNALRYKFKLRTIQYKRATLLPTLKVIQRNLDYKSNVKKIINDLESKRITNINEYGKVDSILKIEDERSFSACCEFLLEYYWDSNYKLAYLIGKKYLIVRPNLSLANKLKMLINHNGELQELANFIALVESLNIHGWGVKPKRVKADLDILKNGLNLNFESDKIPDYKPTDTVFYLLHNSLPYNSGGYATRTQGLLKKLNTAQKKVVGVTRPGYPSDHKKYISKTLPKDIPDFDVIDSVSYLRCDQKTRKSSLTITEYIEEYSENLIELAKQHKPAIIHAASNHPNGLAAVKTAKFLGIKSIYEVRGLWEVTRLSRQPGWDTSEQYQYMANMERDACLLADKVITITHALKDIMVERGVPSSKISVAPNCVNISDFKVHESKSTEILNKLGINKDEVVIGYIGSIVNYEGLDDLIGAVEILINKNVGNFKVLIVGDGAYLDKLISLVNDKKLNKYFIFTGRVPHDEVDEYYSTVDITPFPRKPYLVCEAVSPLKPFEAFACGKAVIVSSVNALTEIVQDEVTGMVFEKGNIEDFADKLRELITNDNHRKALSSAGNQWVIDNRDWSHSAEIVKEIYEELM